MNSLIKNTIENEGFSSKPYVDILVKRNPEKYGISKDEFAIIEKHLDKLKLTFGYGFTFIEEDESRAVIGLKLKKVIKELERIEPFVNELPLEVQEILVEMSYQLGVYGVLGFTDMWRALRKKDYIAASIAMLDSVWAKIQTPQRAKKLAKKMREV
jgi:lysozyme